MIFKFLRGNGRVIVAIIVSIIICITIPLILNRFVFSNGSKPNLTNSEWSTFLGSYI
ncbi:hypothetical protein [Clostridium lacusfryxellense]|uniref:hypothetical protein n=1 Tax=Clostridium lacusfryxellense TaxID=205328 RepID=UPI001C0CDFBC|nr:hypothetical protein [Clostridium lacusfryxellense]MBU3114696.1 hypothetical protein [Clostridium lacusfryxellense]